MAACKLCDGVNLAYVGGTTNLHNHLESKHPSSVAESSGKESDKKQLMLSDYKKCPAEWPRVLQCTLLNILLEIYARFLPLTEEAFSSFYTIWNQDTKFLQGLSLLPRANL